MATVDPYRDMINTLAPGGYKAAKTKTAVNSRAVKPVIAPVVAPTTTQKKTNAPVKKTRAADPNLVAPSALLTAPSGYGELVDPSYYNGDGMSKTQDALIGDNIMFNNAPSYGSLSSSFNLANQYGAAGAGLGSLPASGGSLFGDGSFFDGIGDSLSNLWGSSSVNDKGQVTTTGLGGAKGFLDLAGGAASLYGIYNDIQQNKRAEEAFNLQKQDRENQYKANAAYNQGMKSSGLGTSYRPTSGK